MLEVGTRLSERPSFPLELVRCPICALVQITSIVSSDILFPRTYPYRSNSTRILRDNFADLKNKADEKLGLGTKDLVIDIGSNDGTLLLPFKEHGCRVLGIEPSDAASEASSRGVESLQDYFSANVAREVRSKYGEATIVTATNVFAHIDDVHAIIDGICTLLGDDGVFISESHYLLRLVHSLQYDTIYHEHLRYYHVCSLLPLLAGHGLEVFHVEQIPTHGGSIRVYAGRPGARAINESVEVMLAEEDQAGLNDGSGLTAFRSRVAGSKRALNALLHDIKESGGKIYGIGAPSRSSTLITYTGIDEDTVDAVMEISTSPKVGRYLPGTRIPVCDEALLFEDQPSHALILSWHIAAELMSSIRQKGFKGKFVVPLPEPLVLDR
jgi:SAM-dependent methyltransferase